MATTVTYSLSAAVSLVSRPPPRVVGRKKRAPAKIRMTRVDGHAARLSSVQIKNVTNPKPFANPSETFTQGSNELPHSRRARMYG